MSIFLLAEALQSAHESDMRRAGKRAERLAAAERGEESHAPSFGRRMLRSRKPPAVVLDGQC